MLFNRATGVWEEFTATLDGLPNRVTTQPVRVRRGQKELLFEILIANDAPLGTFKRLECRLSGTENGQDVSYVVAKNTELQIMEPGKLKRDANGRLLTPLEALRQRD